MASNAKIFLNNYQKRLSIRRTCAKNTVCIVWRSDKIFGKSTHRRCNFFDEEKKDGPWKRGIGKGTSSQAGVWCGTDSLEE